MNSNGGVPHILLFERDQQLTAILTSEFQLAGYECHAARTAVEVFDAIARHPVRLVLVDLAQAAAGRREFWVALDAQRRGRGVQVFTFRCMNLAGYGSADPDDRSRSMLADLEVDGMLGVMNLVDTIRSRIPGSTTGSFSRVSTSPTSNSQSSGAMNKLSRQSEGVGSRPAPALNAQVTIPLPSMMSDAAPASQASPSVSARSQLPASSSPSHPSRPVEDGEAGKPVAPTPTFTDKIRAVIYPSSRSFSSEPEMNWLPYNSQHLTTAQPQVAQQPAEADATSALNREAPPQRRTPGNDSVSAQAKPVQNRPSASDDMIPAQAQESSLAKLSRMVRERNATRQDELAVTGKRMVVPSTPQMVQQAQEAQPSQYSTANGLSSGDRANEQAMLQQVGPVDSAPIGTLPLRASPIQGIAAESEPEYRIGQVPVQTPPQLKQPDVPLRTAPIRSSTAALPSELTATSQGQSPTNTVLPALQRADTRGDEQVREASPAFTEVNSLGEGDAERIIARTLVEQVQVQSNAPQATRRQAAPEANATADDLLLNIVQSLPPMSPLPAPSSQAQPPVLTGRATRSLGSVLLEGNLVPQHRLEVAQNIQRMLRGVDMNYQLGEILLMFKLLTADQLLAASLVSYGLISATQISALGRIRQELHAIGLEYDLESLVVLFRILAPEQLREVRASWTT
jgi:hypothetical protein